MSIKGSEAQGVLFPTLWSGPARQFASELDTNVLGGLQLPRKVGHHVNSISTTNTNCHLVGLVYSAKDG